MRNLVCTIMEQGIIYPGCADGTAVDPMEAKFAGMSPYNYAFNNPVMWNDLSGAAPGDDPQMYNGKPVQYTQVTTDYGLYDLTLGYNTETDKFDLVLNSKIIDLRFPSDSINTSANQSFSGVAPLSAWLSATLTAEAAASAIAAVTPYIVPIAIIIVVAYIVSKLLEEILPPTTAPTKEGEEETVTTREPKGEEGPRRSPGNDKYPDRGIRPRSATKPQPDPAPIPGVPPTDGDEENKSQYVYRNMRTVNGMPELGDSGLNVLGIRPKDVLYREDNQMVMAQEHLGPSVTPPPGPPLLEVPFATSKTTTYKLDISVLPLFGLSWYQDKSDHAFIIPAQNMTVEEFKKRVKATAPFWKKN